MQYRLLRNNKESGPFTKAQLEEMGLKPYDLLWIEGRGGAWQYASEIDDLKSIAPVVEEQPYDRFYKGKEKQTTAAKQNTTAVAAPKSPKPRFRISGDKVVMIDNTALAQPQPIQNIVSSIQKEAPAATANGVTEKKESTKAAGAVGPDWEEMYVDWKGDSKDPEPAAPARVQTLEEIKQRYEESKQHHFGDKQHKAGSSAKQNIMAAIAIVVLAVGGYAGYKLNAGKDNEAAAPASVNAGQAEIVQDEAGKAKDTSNESSVPAGGNGNTAQSPISNVPENIPAEKEINNTISAAANKPAKEVPPPVIEIKKDAAGNTQSPVPAKKTGTDSNNNAAVNGALVKNTPTTQVPPAKKTDVPVTAKDKTDNNWSDVKKANTAAPLQIPEASSTTTVKQVAPKKRISDYIAINKIASSASGAGVQNVQLSVKNITDFPIDLAVVDIQYYGANGRYLRGETMYVKNIGSGDNVNVRVPDNRTARSINYKVSLVSSEQKTLYLVGE